MNAERQRTARPRLMIVVNDLGFFWSHRRAVALGALHSGYEVFVTTPGGPRVAELERAGLRHVAWQVGRGSTHPLWELRSVWSLARAFRKVRPHIAHLVTIKPVLYGGALARMLRTPAVVAAVSGMGYLFVAAGRRRGPARRWAEAADRFAFGHPHSRVIVQTRDDEAALRAIGALRPGQAVLIRGSGVDLEVFRASPLPEGTPLVVLPARMLWDKGVGEFVQAAERLRAQGVAVRMALVGPHDLENPAAVPLAQLETWRERGPVEWWGHRDDMPEVLRSAHLVVLPSYREGVPKCLLEAAAAGRAIVTTDAPGCRDVVEHGRNGLLVPPRDAGALAEATASLLGDRERLEAMGKQGRAKAEAEFGIEDVVRAHLSLYRSLCPPQGGAV